MSDEKINGDTPTSTENDQTGSTSSNKPFKPADDELNNAPTLETKQVLAAATGNDAAGNSYCQDSLDEKKDEYGLKKTDASGSSITAVKEQDEEKSTSSDVEVKAAPDADTGSTKKSLNPTAATFIFQSKDQGKNARGGSRRGGFQGGRGGARSGSPAATAPAFVPRTASFGRAGAAGGGAGGPSGRPQQNRQGSAAPDSDAGIASTGSGEVSTGVATESSGDVKARQAGGAVNREPRGYVPPPPTKRSKLSSAELEEKMARMRLVNAETLARSEAQARDAEAYAVQAAQADKADIEREEARNRQIKEEKERRYKEQNRVDQERERARKLKLARLGVGKEGDTGNQKEEDGREGSADRGWSVEREEATRGGFGRRGEERGSWSDRRGRGRGTDGGETRGRGSDGREGGGRGGRGGPSDAVPRDQVQKETLESKPKTVAVEANKTSETRSEIAKESGTSWADSPAGEQ